MRTSAASLVITPELLAQVREFVVERRIADGAAWLEKHRERLLRLDPEQPGAAPLLGYLCQLVDIGYGDAQLISTLLERFPHERRVRLPLADYVPLRLAAGMVAAAAEELETAIGHFDFLLTLGPEVVPDPEMLALAHFWKGRSLRMRGAYESALIHTSQGRELALGLGFPRLAAAMQVLESWLYFQRDELARAVELLRSAEAEIRATDDSTTLGNIASDYGRIALREGRYQQALEHFTTAIQYLRQRDPRHRNVARSLANMAYAKRLIALRLATKCDREITRRRMAAAAPADPGPHGRHAVPAAPARPTPGRHYAQLRADAFAHLEQAEDIYRSFDYHRGLGTVRVDRGFLYFDSGDLERAAQEAEAAYSLGADKADRILMARARILQSMIANARYEEGIEDDGDPVLHAQRAQDYAKDALTLARQTENKRLVARAYIYLGLALANDFFHNHEAAAECCQHAVETYPPPDHDQLWEELHTLQRKVLGGSSIEANLRRWSQGLIDGQSFQQVSESFALLVVPKVWEREGRKVSRVARKLAMSPKKVRYLLAKAGVPRHAV